MNGHVDRSGRALLSVTIKSDNQPNGLKFESWIDTGFTGDLVLPKSAIDGLALRQSGTVAAILADGSEVVLETYTCRVEWFGKLRTLEVVANEGQFPLLGVGLLSGHNLQIDYRIGSIILE